MGKSEDESMAMRREEEVGYDPVEGDRGDMEMVVVAERERTQNIHLPLVMNALAKQTNKCRRDRHDNSSTRKDTSKGAPAHWTMPRIETGGSQRNIYDIPRAT